MFSKRWLSLKTQFKIEFLLPGAGRRKVFWIIPLSTNPQNDQTHSNNSLDAGESFHCLTILWVWRLKAYAWYSMKTSCYMWCFQGTEKENIGLKRVKKCWKNCYWDLEEAFIAFYGRMQEAVAAFFKVLGSVVKHCSTYNTS